MNSEQMKTETMSFKEFLRRRYINKDSVRGDFARDYIRDAKAPHSPTDADQLKLYLVHNRACEQAIRSGLAVWRIWYFEVFLPKWISATKSTSTK